MRRTRIGIIGTGFGQQVHFPAFQAHKKCRVTAICASNLSRTKHIANQLGIPNAYGNWKELVASPEIDAVSIATLPGLQAEIALKAISAGKSVFLEKPFALDVKSAKKIASCANKATIAHMIDFEFPEIQQWQKVKSLLDKKIIGKLRHIAVSWNIETYANKMGLNSWKTQLENGGGTLNLFTSHIFYYLEWFIGPIAEISALLHKAPRDKRTADTFNAISLIFSSGISCSVSVSTDSFPGNGHRVEFYGENGMVVLDNTTSDYAGGFRIFIGKRSSDKLQPVPLNIKNQTKFRDSRIAPVSRLTGRFLNWIHTGKKERPDFNDGLRVQCLLDAARKSNLSGKKVKID